MLNSVYTFSSQFIPVFQEKLSYTLSDVQKRTAIIALAAIALLTVCFIAIQYYRREKVLLEKKEEELDKKNKELTKTTEEIAKKIESLKDKKTEEIKVDSPINNEDEIAAETFLNAMELMFQDRDFMDQNLPPFSVDQQAERHERLKKAISALPSKCINNTTTYRDGMMARQQTLLLQAIMHIKNAANRLEIVKMLLDKGANPLMMGFYYAPIVDPLKEAEKTRDADLIALIKDAIDKRMKADDLAIEKE